MSPEEKYFQFWVVREPIYRRLKCGIQVRFKKEDQSESCSSYLGERWWGPEPEDQEPLRKQNQYNSVADEAEVKLEVEVGTGKGGGTWDNWRVTLGNRRAVVGIYWIWGSLRIIKWNVQKADDVKVFSQQHFQGLCLKVSSGLLSNPKVPSAVQRTCIAASLKW